MNVRKKYFLIVLIPLSLTSAYFLFIKKSPERIEEEKLFQQQVESVSLEGKVEEFPIEGRDHVSLSTDVTYQTNPPTSGDHFAQAKTWGISGKEINDLTVIHALEHGGIWITYKDVDNQTINELKDIARANKASIILSPRSANDDPGIVVVSWGKMMKLDILDKALIQKYIDTYKNQSPENLAL